MPPDALTATELYIHLAGACSLEDALALGRDRYDQIDWHSGSDTPLRWGWTRPWPLRAGRLRTKRSRSASGLTRSTMILRLRARFTTSVSRWTSPGCALSVQNWSGWRRMRWSHGRIRPGVWRMCAAASRLYWVNSPGSARLSSAARRQIYALPASRLRPCIPYTDFWRRTLIWRFAATIPAPSACRWPRKLTGSSLIARLTGAPLHAVSAIRAGLRLTRNNAHPHSAVSRLGPSEKRWQSTTTCARIMPCWANAAERLYNKVKHPGVRRQYD